MSCGFLLGFRALTNLLVAFVNEGMPFCTKLPFVNPMNPKWAMVVVIDTELITFPRPFITITSNQPGSQLFKFVHGNTEEMLLKPNGP